MERFASHFLVYCIVAGWVVALTLWMPVALIVIGLMIIVGTDHGN